jgi:FkbM family methyltransferase
VISYAQNGEDVVLARAFPDVRSGFYVDLGAAHPLMDSVTKHFYDRGWSGVNVEPLRDGHAALDAGRPRDLNLRLAVGTESSDRVFYEAVDAPGLSTFEPALADRARQISRIVEHQVPMITLRHLFEQYVGERTVDFLKIDVEGLEYDVLSTGDWSRFRPRVLVVEGDPERVEQLLKGAHYRQTLFDGINSFWVRCEDSDQLGPALSRPAVRAVDGYQYWYDLFPLRDAVQAFLSCRLRSVGRRRPDQTTLRAVAETYASRPDLRVTFGEPLQLDVAGLLRWAAGAPGTGDPAAHELALHRAELERLAHPRDMVESFRRILWRMRHSRRPAQ